MIRITSIFIVSIFCSAFSTQSNKSKLTLELLNLMHFKETMIDGAKQVITSQIMKDHPAPSDSLNELIDVATQSLIQLVNEDTILQPKILDLYDSFFNESELIEFVAFLRKPVGQKMIKHQIDILMKTNSISQEWFQNVQPKMTELLTKNLLKRRLKKK